MLCDEFAFSLICYSNLDEPGPWTKLEIGDEEIRSNKNLYTNNISIGLNECNHSTIAVSESSIACFHVCPPLIEGIWNKF